MSEDFFPVVRIVSHFIALGLVTRFWIGIVSIGVANHAVATSSRIVYGAANGARD